jgi:hypothetical protein
MLQKGFLVYKLSLFTICGTLNIPGTFGILVLQSVALK